MASSDRIKKTKQPLSTSGELKLNGNEKRDGSRCITQKHSFKFSKVQVVYARRVARLPTNPHRAIARLREKLSKDRAEKLLSGRILPSLKIPIPRLEKSL